MAVGEVRRAWDWRCRGAAPDDGIVGQVRGVSNGLGEFLGRHRRYFSANGVKGPCLCDQNVSALCHIPALLDLSSV